MAFLMDMKASLNVANHVHTAAKVLIKAWLLFNRIQWKKRHILIRITMLDLFLSTYVVDPGTTFQSKKYVLTLPLPLNLNLNLTPTPKPKPYP